MIRLAADTFLKVKSHSYKSDLHAYGKAPDYLIAAKTTAAWFLMQASIQSGVCTYGFLSPMFYFVVPQKYNVFQFEIDPN